MVKIAFGSDLHTEFGDWPKLPEQDTDLLLLAGDTGTYTSEIRWLKEVNLYRPDLWVLGIPGNHTGYDGTSLSEHLDTLKSDAFNLKIVGCTLWTDFCLFNKPNDDLSLLSKHYAINRMNDYRLCYSEKGVLITPDFTQNLHFRHVEFLKENGKNSDIIITHHAPSIRSIDKKYIGDPTNPCYASNLDYLVEELKPKYWIHGHTHKSCKYKIGETTVVCNPKGYRNENPYWSWEYLELGS